MWKNHKRILLKILSAAIFYSIPFAPVQAENDCIGCHETLENSCGLQCADCHVSTNAEYRPHINNAKHPAVIQNPSDEHWRDEKCRSCHKNQIESFKNSAHYSAAGIIGQTRFLWGKTEDISCGNEEWKKIAYENRAAGHTPSELVDNLLAKKCLACHFSADAKNESFGKKRSSGCASCHIPLDQQSGKPLYGHKMQKKPADSVCLTCHNGNHVGGDYYGYFEHDYHNDYNMPYDSEPIFGAYQHRLSSDIHRLAGLKCTDCHKLKGRENHVFSTASCTDCHGGFEKASRTAAKPFNNSVIAHKSFHKKVSCSACHAQWSYQDYGLHLFLDESDNFEMWQNTIMQGDRQIIDYLNRASENNSETKLRAESLNRLSGKLFSGIWYKGWSLRRWEEPVLGIDNNGQYGIIRPLYQYFITYVDNDENIWLDSKIPKRKDGKKGWAWEPYSPHTIGKSGRNCESCHGNPKAAGMGIRQSSADSVSNSITLPSPPISPKARLLNKREIDKLLNKSSEYKKWRALEYNNQKIDMLFKE